MIKRMIVIFSGSALLIAAAIVVALRERMRAVPEVPEAQAPAEVHIKAVERKAEPVS